MIKKEQHALKKCKQLFEYKHLLLLEQHVLDTNAGKQLSLATTDV